MERLTIAIQKDGGGRLADDSRNLLFDAGLNFRPKPRVDYADVVGFPLRVRMLRNSLIAGDVQSGLADFGILGLDMIEESGKNVLRLLPLGFARCELYLGVRKDAPYREVTDLAGQKVVSAYLDTARRYFERAGTEVIFEFREGGEETFVNEGNAEACIVISESGDSRDVNGIRSLDKLLQSEAYFIASPLLKEKGSEKIVQEFLIRIVSVLRAREFTFVDMNCPEEILQRVSGILPSGESPTVTLLLKPDWLSVSSLIPRESFWELSFALQELGVRDIVERVISKVVPNMGDRVIMEMMDKIYA